ncbi:hypothetical protein [Clostridium sp.]|uniref:gp53-like domain-containing protein n=1 Tax=Clostridium sp. TaxID=1506 RepID=UPI00257AC552|nr:hypothetical protein [Clostridium sp.]MBE6055844.1 hypothetical protein [Clostridium sp.]
MEIIKRPFKTKQIDGNWGKCYFETSEDMIKDQVQSLGSSGYRKLPGGLILQWGYYLTPTGGSNGIDRGVYYKTITGLRFPIAFSSRICSINATSNNARCWAYAADSGRLDGFNLGCSNIITADTNNNVYLFWRAIGY